MSANDMNLASSVDELNEVRKSIKKFQEREVELKTLLSDTKEEEIEGANCKVVISYFEKSKSTDWKKACDLAKVKDTILAKCQKDKAAYSIVNIRAL